MRNNLKHLSWIPSIYFMQGFPYAIVTLLTLVLYKRLGISNSTITLVTSLFTLPWVIKPFFAPLLEILATKKHIIIIAQFCMVALLLALSMMLFSGLFFASSVVILMLFAFVSSSNDAAIDAVYIAIANEYARFACI